MKDRFKMRLFDNGEMYYIKDYYWFEERGIHSPDDFDIIPMQCTGLKDKNGKLIYEGDIITYDWLTPIGQVWRTDGKHIVEWHDGFTVIGNIAGYDVEHGKTRNVEVIGNIYENKELLED